MQRLKLTWVGGEANHADRSSKETFGILVTIAVVHFSVSVILFWTSFVLLVDASPDSQADIEDSQFLSNLRSILNLAFGIFYVVIMARARCRVRSRYGIPERTCHGCEDCCCAFFPAAQYLRLRDTLPITRIARPSAAAIPVCRRTPRRSFDAVRS
jgi:hypothetical protein